MARLCYVFAGGGTGGHLFPGLAVAQALTHLEPAASIAFFTTDRPLDRELLASHDYQQVVQPVRPFTLHPLRAPSFLWHWWTSRRLARRFLKTHCPQAVLGLGGYGAGPAVIEARALGIRTAILNPDAIPGRANRHLARHADLVVLQWEVSRGHFPPGTNCLTLGCPVRPEFANADPDQGRRLFELQPERPTLLVTGASQGAHTLNQVMVRVWPRFHAEHPDWQLLHLTGPADQAAVRAAYASDGAPAQVRSFAGQMWLALAAADLVVSRAGASTLAELTALGKPSILLPYPFHRDRHQQANAQVLADYGAAIWMEDQLRPELNEPGLRAALERLTDPRVRASMARAARELGRQGAADAVARWMRSG